MKVFHHRGRQELRMPAPASPRPSKKVGNKYLSAVQHTGKYCIPASATPAYQIIYHESLNLMLVEELMKDRDPEKLPGPVSKMKEARPQINRITCEIYSALETFARLNFNADVPGCIKAINAVNKCYTDNLVLATGQRASARNKRRRIAIPALAMTITLLE